MRAGPRRRGPAGIVVHHTNHLPADEVTVHRGIPVTTPARTLLDLAAAHHRASSSPTKRRTRSGS